MAMVMVMVIYPSQYRGALTDTHVCDKPMSLVREGVYVRFCNQMLGVCSRGGLQHGAQPLPPSMTIPRCAL